MTSKQLKFETRFHDKGYLINKIILILSFILIGFKSNAQNLTVDQLIKIRNSEPIYFTNFLTNRGWEYSGSNENTETGDETFTFLGYDKSLAIIIGENKSIEYNYFSKGIDLVLQARLKQLNYIVIKNIKTEGVNIKVFSKGNLVFLFTSSYNENYGKVIYVTMVISKSIYDKKLKGNLANYK